MKKYEEEFVAIGIYPSEYDEIVNATGGAFYDINCQHNEFDVVASLCLACDD